MSRWTTPLGYLGAFASNAAHRPAMGGWLDKALKHRHKATRWLDNVVVLSPSPDWVKQLPNAKLPDRQDFKHYADDDAGRARAWTRVLHESERLAEELHQLLGQPSIDAQALV